MPEKLAKDFQFKLPQKFEEINIEIEDGVKLNGLFFPAENSKGLIFYIHGNGGSVNSWAHISSHYTDLGYDLFLLDFRGYGKSEGEITSEKQLFDDNQIVYNLFKKNEGNTYTIKDANGEEITNDVNAVRSNYDILVYDILFKKTILLKGFYTDTVKIGEWNNMEEFNSPTGLYWIFSETSEFFVIQNGTLLDKSLFTLVKTQKEDDFIVREAGIDKYIIRDLNSKGFETFYPLEFLNN